MKDLLAENWKNALSEVLASLVGTVGIVLAISTIVAAQGSFGGVAGAFSSYFQSGQLGLPILSISGIVFIALRRHGPHNALVSVILYIFLILPIIITSVVVGMNPGFQDSVLKGPTISLLWWMFVLLHVVWLVVLILQPTVPTPEETGREESARVNNIKRGAAGRV